MELTEYQAEQVERSLQIILNRDRTRRYEGLLAYYWAMGDLGYYEATKLCGLLLEQTANLPPDPV